MFARMGRGLALGAALLLGAAGMAGAEPVRGGTLRFLVETEPPTLVTIAHTAGSTQRVSSKITEGLLTYDFDLKPIPVLATAWEVSADGLRYEFKLRQGVKWHDGQDFTAADVAFSFNLLKQVHPRGRATFANLVEVQTPDPYTAIVILSKPAPFLLTALDGSESPIVAKHIYGDADPLTHANGKAPIGTGPFIFKEWVKGSHVLLERNPNYWDAGKPYLDRIVARFIPDDAARAAAFEAGEIDLAGGPAVARADLGRIAALPNLGSDNRGYVYQGSFSQLFFNFDNPLLRDRRVRLAIAQAIDLDKLLQVVYYGYGKVSATPITPYLTQFYDASVPRYPFDPAAAGKLLDEAGYPKKADGKRFKLRLYNNPYNTKANGEFIRQALGRIGIEVDFQAFDFSTYITRTYTNRDWDITADSLSVTFDPTLGVQRAYWSKNFKVGLPFSNAGHYENKEVDAVLEAAAFEPDAAKRKALWNQFQHLVHDDVASLNLIAPEGVTLFNKKVKDHTWTALGPNDSFARTYIEK